MTCKTLLALSLLGSLCVAGCGGSSSGGSTTTASPTITSVSVSCTPTSIQTGQTSQCSATVSGTGSYSSGVTWSATDGTTTTAGVFTPSAAGTATITATSTEDSTKSGSATVTVTVPVTITSVSVACSPASILTTQTSTCTPTVTGTGSFSSSVSWSVSPTSMGSVSGSGVFSPSGAGTATITATSTQDATKSGSATVSVSVPPSITSVTTSCVSTTILAGQTTQCSATVQGTNNPSQAVNWSVNNTVGGNSTIGIISTSGVYTAPDPIPTSGSTITITATSQADSSKSNSASVSLLYPVPSMTGASPQAVNVASSNTNVTISGMGFSRASILLVDSTSTNASYVSPTQLVFTLATSLETYATLHTIVVSNPSPGGGNSPTASLAVNNLLPNISSITPSSVQTGAPDTVITIRGSYFTPQSQVMFGTFTINSTYISGSEILATIPAAQFTSDQVSLLR